MLIFFFFKQKTAYEMRISDWSSDVCSSDLLTVRSYTDEVRDKLLDGIARVAKGEAIAAGLPDDKMPVVKIDRNEYTPSTFNTPDFTEKKIGGASRRESVCQYV